MRTYFEKPRDVDRVEIGLPSQRVSSGTDSARHHQRRGTQRGAGPDRAAGQHDSARAQRGALTEDHSIRPQDPVVEEVGLQHAAPVDASTASAERHQVRLRQPVALAPRRPGRSARRARAATGHQRRTRHRTRPATAPPAPRRRCPPARCATRSRSTAGAPPPRCRPTSSHFATTDTRHAAHARPPSSTAPDSSAAPTAAERAQRGHRQHGQRRRAEHRHQPAQLHQRRAPTAAAPAGRTSRLWSPSSARPRQLHRRQAQVRAALLGLLRRRRQHARPDRRPARCRPGAVIPELPRNARRPISARPIRSQPPPSSYGAISVSSARNAPSPTVVRLGSASTVDTSAPPADLHAEQPQPHRRDQPGVQREQRLPGEVHQLA